MSFQTALTNLAGLTVTGISHNFGIDAVPDSLHRAQLPALLVMPIATQDDSLFQESGQAFEGVAFGDGTKTVQYISTHLLIVAPAQKGKGLQDNLPSLITSIDNYFTALSADVTLGGALEHPAEIKVEPGIYKVGNTDYIGCAFRHRWIIAV